MWETSYFRKFLKRGQNFYEESYLRGTYFKNDTFCTRIDYMKYKSEYTLKVKNVI